MNLFYEDYPRSIFVRGKEIPIVTDFREYIKLIDMLKDENLSDYEKSFFISEYFLKEPDDFEEAINQLKTFVSTRDECQQPEDEECSTGRASKELFSFSIDYSYILAGFLQEYGIDLSTIKYMHWWKFRALFDGLGENTEIKKRIMYRGIDLSTVKDKDERRRIRDIQRLIRLPETEMTDFEIGDVFGQ